MVMDFGQRFHTQTQSVQIDSAFQKSTQTIPEIHIDFSPQFQNCTRSLVEVRWVHAQVVKGRMVENPPHHGSSKSFYLHGLGLTLVTHETTCLPSACVPSTIWKSHVIPKELRIKTYNSHGLLE